MSRLIKVVISCLLFIIVIVACIPFLLSTSWGLKTVTRFYSGDLHIDSAHFRWFGGQEMYGLTYKDETGREILSFEELKSDTKLIYLLFGGRNLSKTFIDMPYVVVQQGVSDGDHLIVDRSLEISDGTLVVEAPESAPITISKINIQDGVFSAQTAEGRIEGKMEKNRFYAKITNLPVAILDRVQNTTLFTDALGKTLDLEVLWKNQEGITATIKSPNISGHVKGNVLEEHLVLEPGSHLAFTITPRLFRTLLPEEERETWKLVSNTNLSLNVTEGRFPIDLEGADYHDIVLNATGTIDRAEINHKTLQSYSLNNFSFDVMALHNLEIHYKGEIVGKETSQLAGTISLTPDNDVLFTADYKRFPIALLQLISPETEQKVRRFFGPTFDLIAQGTYDKRGLNADFQIGAPDLQMNGAIKGEKFEVIGTKQTEGKTADYLGDIVAFQLEGTKDAFNGKLSTPYYLIDVRGRLGSIEDLEFVATGEMIALPFQDEFPQVRLKNGSFVVNVNNSRNKIYGQASVTTNEKGSRASDIRFDISNYLHGEEIDFAEANISFSAHADRMPVALLEPLMPAGIDLSVLVGPTAKIKAKGSYTPTQDPRGTLQLEANADGFEAQLAISIDGTLTIAQDQAAFIHWELTPERYASIMSAFEHTPAFELVHPASVDLNIHELTCPTTLPEDISYFLCESGFVGDLSIGTLSLRNFQTHEYLIVKNTKGSIEGVDFSQEIDLNLHGDILAQNIPHSEQSAFTFEGKMLNFWTRDGKFNRDGLTLDGELSLELLPVKQITEIFPLDAETQELAQALLGEFVNARIYGEISQLAGPFTVDLKASNLKATLPMQLSPNALYLRDNVTAELTLTPEVNQTLLKDINPLLIAGAYSDHPITVTLDAQNFMIPIPYALENVQIGRATIDIGKIWVRNGGQFQLLMDFLEAKEITPQGDMSAWFTPIYMSLQNGVATYERFDALLAGNIHLIFWGQVNLITDQVQMVMGIGPTTLMEKFKLKGLKKSDIFQLKMRGTTNNVDLDWSGATTRLGVIIAKTSGSSLGAIVGGILEALVTTFGDRPAPPPTTDPLPWEKY